MKPSGITTYEMEERRIRTKAPWGLVHRAVRLYVYEHKTTRQVGEATGVNASTVWSWMSRLGVARPRPLATARHATTPDDEEEVVRLYRAPHQHTHREIAAIMGRSMNWVQGVLRRRGVRSPPPHVRRRQRGTLGKHRAALRLPTYRTATPHT